MSIIDRLGGSEVWTEVEKTQYNYLVRAFTTCQPTVTPLIHIQYNLFSLDLFIPNHILDSMSDSMISFQVPSYITSSQDTYQIPSQFIYCSHCNDILFHISDQSQLCTFKPSSYHRLTDSHTDLSFFYRSCSFCYTSYHRFQSSNPCFYNEVPINCYSSSIFFKTKVLFGS